MMATIEVTGTTLRTPIEVIQDCFEDGARLTARASAAIEPFFRIDEANSEFPPHTWRIDGEEATVSELVIRDPLSAIYFDGDSVRTARFIYQPLRVWLENVGKLLGKGRA